MEKLRYYTKQLISPSMQLALDSTPFTSNSSSRTSSPAFSENKTPFFPIKIQKTSLSSFHLEISSEVSYQRNGVLQEKCHGKLDNLYCDRSAEEASKNADQAPIEATISDGAFIFCVKTYESVSVSQLTRIVQDKLLKLLNLSRHLLQRLSVRFVHADPLEGGEKGGAVFLKTLHQACVENARHLVFEACLLATPGEAAVWTEQCPADQPPVLLQAGFFMVYVLLHHWD